jgi:hypothetical protein
MIRLTGHLTKCSRGLAWQDNSAIHALSYRGGGFHLYVTSGEEIAYASAFFRKSSVLSHAVFADAASYTWGRDSFMKACCAS